MSNVLQKEDDPALATDLSELLHRRITENCSRLYQDGHFPQAAFEAMKQVELALRDITVAPKRFFGQRLIKRAFKEGRGIKLVVPLAPENQDHALSLFEGAFGYYRNYTAHEGEKIDKQLCARILVLASELLYLLNASERTLPGVGGIEGMVESGIFKSVADFKRCLKFYEDGYWIGDQVYDGYLEDLAHCEISEQQEQLFWELNLVQSRSVDPMQSGYDSLEVIELTPHGRLLLDETLTDST